MPPGVKSIIVEPLEPPCPFCGSLLNNAGCRCPEFSKALRHFKINRYGTEEIDIRAYKVKTNFLLDFDINHTKIKKAPLNDALLAQITGGSEFCLRGIGKWLLSEARFDKGILTFWFTQTGSPNIWQCEMELPDFNIPQYRNVNAWKTETNCKTRPFSSKRIGGYSIEHTAKIIETIAYSEFLTKLQ